jgi:hypothetical protein
VIDPKSLVVNNFAELFSNYPTIARVYFNGAKGAELYRGLAGERDWLGRTSGGLVTRLVSQHHAVQRSWLARRAIRCR